MILVIGKVRAAVVAAATELEVEEAEVWGRCHKPEVVEARQLAYWAAFELGRIKREIGEVMGKDHSTVICGIKGVRRKCAASASFERRARNVLDLARQIYATKRAHKPVPRRRRILYGAAYRSARMIADARRNHLGQHQGPPNWYEGRGAE